MKVFIAGDSTAACKEENKRPETGWGEKLGLFFDKNVIIRNFAKNGRSSKSFMNEGLLDLIDKEINENDYLFIQFGHNDGKPNPDRHTTFEEYQDNLMKYANVALSHKATPIFLTSISRRRFKEDKTLDINTVEIYPEACKDFCKKNNFICLDMYTRTYNLLKDMGYEDSTKLFLQLRPHENDNYPDGVIDNTHLNDFGATVIASIVIDELKKVNTDLVKHINQ